MTSTIQGDDERLWKYKRLQCSHVDYISLFESVSWSTGDGTFGRGKIGRTQVATLLGALLVRYLRFVVLSRRQPLPHCDLGRKKFTNRPRTPVHDQRDDD